MKICDNLQSGAVVLGWVISQPTWYRHLWHRDNKSEPEQDVGINLLTLLSKLTSGQALTYVLPHKGAATAPELATENQGSSEKVIVYSFICGIHKYKK